MREGRLELVLTHPDRVNLYGLVDHLSAVSNINVDDASGRTSTYKKQ
ncbi:hypothetical protein SAMN05444354_101438 [Stigmatella aurantiaca]|uniref:Uncharacterized protein n=1 Tax=Stigmatella aurantiaca TaxID=41 RepID=A0A1H7GKE8_STIAU|nr:hypothetical protein SAMN05444354_101438 [Stigmatella aurantiaca]